MTTQSKVEPPQEQPLNLDLGDLLSAHAQVAAGQITQLIRRVAELEATVAAYKRLLAEARGQAA